MEIKFLKKMLKYPTLRNWTNQGMLLEEIKRLETIYNNGSPFPQSLREFLYIAGKQSNLGDIDRGSGYEWMQSEAEKQLKEWKQEIIRPYFVISQLDKCEIFSFIYLDENFSDPYIYTCLPAYVDEGEPLISSKPQKTFSNYIIVCLERTIVEDDELFKTK
ncbi:hypothetical protein [Chryseobacterium sp. RLHN22]|uniref:hypothetical protein n=1 Tax=Chryseobacterium sp. RLHN22 TaxID=3437885 RepID=UPI003D9B2F1B